MSEISEISETRKLRETVIQRLQGDTGFLYETLMFMLKHQREGNRDFQSLSNVLHEQGYRTATNKMWDTILLRQTVLKYCGAAYFDFDRRFRPIINTNGVVFPSIRKAVSVYGGSMHRFTRAIFATEVGVSVLVVGAQWAYVDNMPDKWSVQG